MERTMEISPYLNFNGNCKPAFEFYAKALGGKIEIMQTHGDSPMKDQTPLEWHDKILHASMTVGNGVLMGSDMPPGEVNTVQGIWVSLNVDQPADAERIFGALSDNGDVKMPMQKTFWGLFGMTIDRFGIPWMVNSGAGASA
jgi:PhnB protein